MALVNKCMFAHDAELPLPRLSREEYEAVTKRLLCMNRDQGLMIEQLQTSLRALQKDISRYGVPQQDKLF